MANLKISSETETRVGCYVPRKALKSLFSCSWASFIKLLYKFTMLSSFPILKVNLEVDESKSLEKSFFITQFLNCRKTLETILIFVTMVVISSSRHKTEGQPESIFNKIKIMG